MSSVKTYIKKIWFPAVLFAAVLVSSVILYRVSNPAKRYVFLVESLDDDVLHLEQRFLPVAEEADRETEIVSYVSELLLGAPTDRYKRIFPLKSKLESCFLRDSVLYINLSEDALIADSGTSSTFTACSLIKENVFRNFPEVREVRLFIDSMEAYALKSEKIDL